MGTRATLLLALDGSEKDERALTVAAAFAELADADVHIVRVLPRDVAMSVAAGAAAGAATGAAAGAAAGAAMQGVPDVVPILRESIEDGVRDAAQRLRPRAPHDVTSEVLEGHVAQMLTRAADARRVRAIVMATRARGLLGQAFLGSVGDAIVRRSQRPVLLVPPGADDMGGKQVLLRRAIVPFDGSRRALAVVSHLLALPLPGALELILFQAVSLPAHDVRQSRRDQSAPIEEKESGAWVGATASQAEKRITSLARRVRQAGAKVDVAIVETDDPAAAIVHAVRDHLAHFIVMTTHGAGGLKRLMLGSVASNVVRRSEVPVLLVTRPGCMTPGGTR